MSRIVVTPDPPVTTHRIVGAAYPSPYVEITGAEISIAFASLDEIDLKCIEYLKNYFKPDIEKIILEEMRKKFGKNCNPKDLLTRLKDLNILHYDHITKKYYIPQKLTTVKILHPQSLFLFLNRNLLKFIKKEKTQDKLIVKINGTSLGYALCKIKHNPTLQVACSIAKYLSTLEPDTPIDPQLFELIEGERRIKICYNCFKNKTLKDWIPTGEVVVKTHKVYSSITGTYILRIFSKKKGCPYGIDGENDSIKNMEFVDAIVSHLKDRVGVRAYEFSFTPIKVDSTINCAKFPKEIFIENGKLCGLALSIALEWPFNEKEEHSIRRKSKILNNLLYGVYKNRLLVLSDISTVIKFLKRVVKERNNLLNL